MAVRTYSICLHAPLSRSALLDFATFYFSNRTRRGSTPVSTFYGNRSEFSFDSKYIIYFYLKKRTIQFEIWKMVWTILFFFFQFLSIRHAKRFFSRICKTSSEEKWTGQYPVWMTQEPRKGDFRELKSKTFPGVACPDFPRRLRLRCSFRKSVSIYPRSAPAPYTNRSAIRYGFRAGAVDIRYSVKLAWGASGDYSVEWWLKYRKSNNDNVGPNGCASLWNPFLVFKYALLIKVILDCYLVFLCMKFSL